jgi:hypothetical protein
MIASNSFLKQEKIRFLKVRKLEIKVFFIFFILFSSCATNKNDKIEVKSIFNQTKKIEIYAYLDKNRWEKKDRNEYLKANNINVIPSKYLRNKIVLNHNQIKKLEKELIKSKQKIEDRADCFDPRHTIVFYNENEDILGDIELCFQCSRANSSKKLKILGDKMLFQRKLFQEFGINYFEETKEEQEDFTNKMKEQELKLERKYKNKNE